MSKPTRAQRSARGKKKRPVTGNDSPPPDSGEGRSQETTATRFEYPAPLLERGDLGIVSGTIRAGRIPLSKVLREQVGPFLGGVMTDDQEATRDRVRAAQTIVAVDRLNQQEESREDIRPEPPTIHVSTDPDYWRWRHEQARKQIRADSEN